MKQVWMGVALAAAVQSAAADNLPDFVDIVDKQSASVVNISTSQTVHGAAASEDPTIELFRHFGIPVPPNGGNGGGGQGGEYQARSLGSGFVLESDGVILTNAHVVKGAEEITVKLQDKREFKAKVLGSDARTDVAVLKIEATGLPAVHVGNVDKLKVGEWVVAIGSPFGFESTVTKGIVSQKHRSLPQEFPVPFIQTDVPINPGNSGGPLFNMKGEVVGINSQIYSRTGGYMGVSFAIPIDVAVDVADQLRKNGRVVRGRIGVAIQEVTPDLAETFGLSKPQGALVGNVEKGAPADKAGIVSGDIIIKVQGKPVADREDVQRQIAAVHPGTVATVTVWRKGAEKDLSVTVAEQPVDNDSVIGKSDGSGTAEMGKLGLYVHDLTDEQRKALNLDSGVVIDRVSGPASKAGLRQGDIIISVNDTSIKSSEQLAQVAQQLANKKTLALLVKRGEQAQFVSITREIEADAKVPKKK